PAVVLRRTNPVLVHHPEIFLGFSVALRSGEPVPLHSLCVILRYTDAAFIHHAKFELSDHIALFGGRHPQLKSCRIVAALEGGSPALQRPPPRPRLSHHHGNDDTRDEPLQHGETHHARSSLAPSR